jgi:hypothetical protein
MTISMLVGGVAIFALTATASASPFAGAVSEAAADIELKELVHSCHREVLPDRQGSHYHRRNCRRVDVSKPDYGPFGPYDPGRCYWVGLARVCP